jgi:carbon-monoxide dehydrogenase medium subunit
VREYARVKPAPFDYAAPDTLDEVLELLTERGDGASVLAGGQSLVPMLNLRIVRPELVVDVNRVPGLDGISAANGTLRLGALTRLATLERIESLPQALRAALPHVAHPQIRNRTTIGGSLAHADPASELPAVVLALEGEMVLASKGGERVVPAEEFFLGPFTTVRRSDELVAEVRLRSEVDRGVFVEFARRRGDFALAGVCAARTAAAVRIAAFGASPVPALLRGAAEAAAAGEPPDRVGAVAAREVEPWDDVLATAAYRRDLIATLVRRALEALTR